MHTGSSQEATRLNFLCQQKAKAVGFTGIMCDGNCQLKSLSEVSWPFAAHLSLVMQTCFKVPLSFQNTAEYWAEICHKVSSKIKQIGYWDACQVYKKPAKCILCQDSNGHITFKDGREEVDDEQRAVSKSCSRTSDYVFKIQVFLVVT